MLPLSLLRAADGSPILVELKGGETYNGRVVSCDTFMNMNLQEVICTSADGSRFWKLPSCYVRGSAIKYLRLPPTLLAKAEEKEAENARNFTPRGGGGRGRGRGRGRFDSGRGGGRGRGRGGRDGGGRGRGRGRSGRSSGRGESTTS